MLFLLSLKYFPPLLSHWSLNMDDDNNNKSEKWKYGLSVNDYRAVALPKSYLIVILIIKQGLKSIG